MKRLLIAAMVPAAALLLAPQASADNSTYLQALTRRGMVITKADNMIIQGNLVCYQLNSSTGDVVVANYLEAVVGYDAFESAAILWSAVEELCPWHDHRGQATSVKLPPRTAPKGAPITGGMGGRVS